MELLIRVHARVAEKVTETKTRGDVIAAKPDGWPWTARERTSPAWRILRVPDLTEIEAEALLSPELDPTGVLSETWVRQYKLDLDNPLLPEAVQAYIADDARKGPILEMPDGRALLSTITVSRGRAMDRDGN